MFADDTGLIGNSRNKLQKLEELKVFARGRS